MSDASPAHSIIETLIDKNPDAVIIVGFNDCLMGTITKCGQNTVALYSTNMIIDNLMGRGLDEDDSWNHYYHNIEMADLGPNGPMMLNIDFDE